MSDDYLKNVGVINHPGNGTFTNAYANKIYSKDIEILNTFKFIGNAGAAGTIFTNALGDGVGTWQHNSSLKTSKIVVVNADGTADYTTIKDALAYAASLAGDAITIYITTGVYFEDNPLVIPQYTRIEGINSRGRVIVAPLDVNSPVFNVGDSVGLLNISILGATNSSGVYWDGSGKDFALVRDCLIVNCLTGILIENAPGRLTVFDTVVFTLQPFHVCTYGMLVRNGAEARASAFRCENTAGTFTNGIYMEGSGTYVTADTINLDSIDQYGMYCEGDFIFEGNDINNINCQGTGLYIGNPSTNAFFSCANLQIRDALVADVNIAATTMKVFSIISGAINKDKFLNPNNVTILSFFASTDSNDNKSLVVQGDLSVGTPFIPTKAAFGNGDSNARQVEVLSNDNGTSGTWTSHTDDAKDSTLWQPFAGLSTNLNRSLFVGFMHSEFYGMEILVTTIATITATARPYFEFQFWNGAAWENFNYMVSLETNKEAKATRIFEDTGYIFVRFGRLTNWVTNTLDGITKYWVRVNISSANVTDLVSPTVNTLKIQNNSVFISENGFLQYFGNARPVRRLPWDLNLSQPFASSPGNQDFYITQTIGMGRTENRFNNNVVDRIGLVTIFPRDIDTSHFIKLSLIFFPSVNGVGDIEWIIDYDFSKNGDNIYLASGSAPVSTPNTKQVSTIVPLNNQQETQLEVSILLDVSELIAYDDTTNNGDFLFVNITRDATAGNPNDTFVGDIVMMNLSAFYIAWNNGGSIRQYYT